MPIDATNLATRNSIELSKIGKNVKYPKAYIPYFESTKKSTPTNIQASTLTNNTNMQFFSMKLV